MQAVVEVAGSDATGAMYGGLEVAELVRLGLPIKDQNRTPFIRKRGIKFNIPLDARTPSYDWYRFRLWGNSLTTRSSIEAIGKRP
jgi:hypothetical protein